MGSGGFSRLEMRRAMYAARGTHRARCLKTLASLFPAYGGPSHTLPSFSRHFHAVQRRRGVERVAVCWKERRQGLQSQGSRSTTSSATRSWTAGAR